MHPSAPQTAAFAAYPSTYPAQVSPELKNEPGDYLVLDKNWEVTNLLMINHVCTFFPPVGL